MICGGEADIWQAGLCVSLLYKMRASLLVKSADLKSKPVVTFLSPHGADIRGMSGYEQFVGQNH